VSTWRTGNYPEILEARISPQQYRQLEKVAEILHTTRAQLMRYMIESMVADRYGVASE
jgi:hypothetical protein